MDDGIDVDLARLADDGCPHLDESQRAVVAAAIVNLRLGDNQHTVGSQNYEPTPPVSQRQAAELFRLGQGRARPWDDPTEYLTMDESTGQLVHVRRDPKTGAEQVKTVDLADALRVWTTVPVAGPDEPPPYQERPT